MPFTCPVCESTEYEALDGLYFCKICSTQSQDLHVQELDDIQYDGRYSGLKQVKKAKKRNVITREMGRPWTIYEAYQCIILAQCDALISLGAREDLKEVVYLLWANYLAKLQVAFCKDEKIVPDLVFQTGRGRQREIHRGTLEKPWNRRKYMPGVGSKRPLFDSSESDSDSTNFIDEDLTDKKSYQKAINSPEWMNLKKTAAFCYIGLRITNQEIIPCQFLRWLYEGKVPFMSTTHLLNSDMVLYGEDYLLFQPVAMTVEMLIQEMNKITSLLMLDKIPAPSVEFMIDVLIAKLDLPNELKEVCKRLCSKVPLALYRRKTDYKNVDFSAIQYIALALTIIFGLDDSAEHRLSQYSQDAQKLVGSAGQLFVWNEWRCYQIEKGKNELDVYQESKKYMNYKIHHLDQLLKTYENFRREERHICLYLTKKNVEHHTSLLEGLGNPLKMALAGNDIKEGACKAPTFDESLKEKFTESTLCHIIDIDAFKAKFKDTMDESSWQSNKCQRQKIINKGISKRYNANDEKTLYETRPNSYLWLLEVLSNLVGCNIVQLDLSLTKLEENFIE